MTDPLRQYALRRDAEAFRLLVEHYQRLVYSAARRRLQHQHDIEDVVQTTFLKLARAAGTIRRDLAAWLYCTTINAANELIRRDTTRRRHEALAAADGVTKNLAQPPDWQSISLIVDEVMLELPAPERSLLVEHFFQGRSQRELAKELRVSQSTITRRLRDAVDALRGLLAKRGVTADSPGVEATLGSLAAIAIPVSLTGELAKIGLVGTGASVPAPATTGLTGLAVKMSVAAIGLAAIVATGVTLGIQFHAPAAAQVVPAKPIEVAAPPPAAAATTAASTAPAATTVNEVIALSHATLDRFQQLETNFTQIHFPYLGDVLVKEANETDVFTSRKSLDQGFYELNYTTLDAGVLRHGATKGSFGPAFAKTLDTYDQGNVTQHVGHAFSTVNGVASAKMDIQSSANDVLHAMWDPSWWDRMTSWDNKPALDHAKLTRDAASGFITLTTDVDERLPVAITLDPAKGYEPITIAIHIVRTGKIWMFTFSDFREVDKNLWLPFHWTNDQPGTQLSKFEIQSAKLNGPFKPEELDFEFPADAGITNDDGKVISRTPGPGEMWDPSTGVISKRPGRRSP